MTGFAALIGLVALAADRAGDFAIHVVDDQTGRGVPLVELRTVHQVRLVTDSNGIAAFHEPGLMGREVFFHVQSHGYEVPADSFGYRGVALRAVAGQRATLRIKRLNVAERLCRLTGAGIYADSLRVGEPTPLQQPALAGGVMGQDSAMALPYRGRMLWFWGDTDRANYPLGNFRTTGAVATLPQGQSDASRGLDYSYFAGKDGFARAMVPFGEPGMVWIGGLATLGQGDRQRLYAHYSRMRSLGERLEHGLIRWNDGREEFEVVRRFDNKESWRFIDGHPIRLIESGREHLAGGSCFPTVRTPADEASLMDPLRYEAYTCLNRSGRVERDAAGKVLYRWQKELPPITPSRELDLVRKGSLKLHEARFLPRDPDGNTIVPHGGSVAWNPWRKRWIMIATREGGKDSYLGEVYYSEADAPVGPWTHAVKIATHLRYSFYNPVHHPFLDRDGGRTIFFEGTYTDMFSGNENPTPRYNYNQILYRLDLGDPRLKPVQRSVQ